MTTYYMNVFFGTKGLDNDTIEELSEFATNIILISNRSKLVIPINETCLFEDSGIVFGLHLDSEEANEISLLVNGSINITPVIETDEESIVLQSEEPLTIQDFYCYSDELDGLNKEYDLSGKAFSTYYKEG